MKKRNVSHERSHSTINDTIPLCSIPPPISVSFLLRPEFKRRVLISITRSDINLPPRHRSFLPSFLLRHVHVIYRGARHSLVGRLLTKRIRDSTACFSECNGSIQINWFSYRRNPLLAFAERSRRPAPVPSCFSARFATIRRRYCRTYCSNAVASHN